MLYLKFLGLFVVAHTVSYLIAGAISLRFSKDIYESKQRLCTFLMDMSNEQERKHVEKYFLPAQILRGILMAIVLLPILSSLGELSFLLKFFFFASLMFVYSHLAAVSPFLDNIEGQVYFRRKYIQKKSFYKFQLEMLMYCMLFGLLMTVFIGFIL